VGRQVHSKGFRAKVERMAGTIVIRRDITSDSSRSRILFRTRNSSWSSGL
jgi:hypothetical protein